MLRFACVISLFAVSRANTTLRSGRTVAPGTLQPSRVRPAPFGTAPILRRSAPPSGTTRARAPRPPRRRSRHRPTACTNRHLLATAWARGVSIPIRHQSTTRRSAYSFGSDTLAVRAVGSGFYDVRPQLRRMHYTPSTGRLRFLGPHVRDRRRARLGYYTLFLLGTRRDGAATTNLEKIQCVLEARAPTLRPVCASRPTQHDRLSDDINLGGAAFGQIANAPSFNSLRRSVKLRLASARTPPEPAFQSPMSRRIGRFDTRRDRA